MLDILHDCRERTTLRPSSICREKQRRASGRNTVRFAVRAELVEAHSPFDRLRANELKRTALRQVDEDHGDTIRARVALLRPVAEGTERRDWEVFVGRR